MSFLKKYHWLILPLFAWVLVRFVFNFNGLYGQDAYAYFLHAKEWRDFMLGGNVPEPFFWPPNYSIVAALFSFFTPNEFYAAQLVSVLSFAGVGGLLNTWIKRNFQTSDFQRIAYVIIVWFLSPYIFRLGMQSMSDMLAMLFLTASFTQLWEFDKTGSFKSLLLWSVATSLAITTRYPAVVVLAIPIGCVGLSVLRKREFRNFVFALTLGLLPIMLAIGWKLISGGMDVVFTTDVVSYWSLNHWFSSTHQNSDANFSYQFPNLIFNLGVFVHPGILFFGVILSAGFVLSDKIRIEWICLLCALVYLAFLSGVPFQNSRVLSFIAPVLCLIWFSTFLKITHLASKYATMYRLGITFVVLLQVALSTRAMQPSINYNKLEREIVDWVNQNAKQKPIYTSDFVQLFDAYQTGNKAINIFSDTLSDFNQNSLFLYNEEVAVSKLMKTSVSENWKRANEMMEVRKQQCWDGGWCIYSLHAK